MKGSSAEERQRNRLCLRESGNMEKGKKLFLRVQPVYTMIVWFILFCAFFFLATFPFWLWEREGAWIIYSVLMVLGALCLLVISIYYCQYAAIDEKGICIRNIFCTIAKAKWSGIYSITKQKLVTHESRGSISFNWLVIRSDKKDRVRGRGGENKRNRPPWYIIATKKNIAAIEKFCTVKRDEAEALVEKIIAERKGRRDRS